MELSGLTQELQAALLQSTKAAASLPGPSDLSFHRALDRSLHRSLGEQSARVLALAQQTLSYLQSSYDDSALTEADLDGDMILEGEYKLVADSLERVLERADEALEYAAGLKKPPVSAAAVEEAAPSTATPHKLARSLYLADIPKPQDQFIHYVKPPALPPYGQDEPHDKPLWTPLHVSRKRLRTKQVQQTLPPRNAPFGQPYMAYAHPYEQEIESSDLPTRLLVAPDTSNGTDEDVTVKMDQRFDETPYAWVDTLDGLSSMLDEIRQSGEKNTKDLAIDVEHHDKRSWQGLTSLVQLSTYDKDYVVDVLAPEVRENAHLLNEFTASKDWIKVIHGAQRDIIWLQRDLGIYVVGLFDTYFATHALNLGQHSLASLLDSYTSFIADKKYQQADWRIRPLPTEMAHYARSDTHFLLHIFNSLVRAVHNAKDGFSATERLREIWVKSRDTSLKVHTHVPYSSDPKSNVDVRSLLERLERELPSSFLSPSDEARLAMTEKIKRLAYVREKVARESDDGPAFVMPFKAIRALFESLSKIENAQDVREALARVNASKPLLGREEEILEALKATPPTQSSEATVAGGVSASSALDSVWSAPRQSMRAATSDLFAPSSSSSSSYTSDAFKNFRAASSSLFPSSSSASSTSLKAKGKRRATTEDANSSALTSRIREESVKKVHETLLLGGALSNHVSGISASASIAFKREEEAPAKDEAETEQRDTNHTFVAPTAPAQSTSAPINTFSSASSKAAKPTAERDDEPIVVSELSKSQTKKKNKKKRDRVDESQANGTESASTSDSSKRKKLDPVPTQAAGGETAADFKKKKKKGKKERPETVPFDPSAQPSILDAPRPSARPTESTAAPEAKAKPKPKKDKKDEKGKQGGSATPEFKRIRVPNFEKKGSKSKHFA